MAKLKNVVAVTGKYEKDGQSKNRYTTCGALVEANGKQYVILDVIPAPTIGKDGVSKWFFSLYDDDKQKAEKPQAKPELNDDIPF